MSTTDKNGTIASGQNDGWLLMLPEGQQEIERGLQFTNVMLTVNQEQANEALAYIQALGEVLVQKGVIRPEEIDEPLERARQEVTKTPMPRVRLADMGDKYEATESVEIDCAARLHLCHARCCTFQFYLTKQDLDEGVARWDYGNPYWIKKAEDGYCIHCDPATRGCTIHAQRPHVCRKYDCRHDSRVWIDFEKRIPAPLETPTQNAPVAMAAVAMQHWLHQEQENGAAVGEERGSDDE